MNKKVIYTCLVGNYDVLRQPLAIDESYDYICFSNDIKEERVGSNIKTKPGYHAM